MLWILFKWHLINIFCSLSLVFCTQIRPNPPLNFSENKIFLQKQTQNFLKISMHTLLTVTWCDSFNWLKLQLLHFCSFCPKQCMPSLVGIRHFKPTYSCNIVPYIKSLQVRTLVLFCMFILFFFFFLTFSSISFEYWQRTSPKWRTPLYTEIKLIFCKCIPLGAYSSMYRKIDLQAFYAFSTPQKITW